MRRQPSMLLGAALAAGATVLLQGLAGGAASALPDAGAPVAPEPRTQTALLGAELGLKAIGLTTGGRLVHFDTSFPGFIDDIGAITGLTPDTSLVGIDYRIQDGRLYGVGNLGGVYVISTSNATATKVSQLTAPLVGTWFGVDFNPAANRLRIVSDLGENLRHNIDDPTGTPAPGVTVVDAPLNFPPTVTPAQGISGVAYTNNDLDPSTATTLFDIDANLDQVVIQSPANNGTLVPAGNLGVAAGPGAGFDIYSTLRNGRSVGSSAYASLFVNGRYGLYSVELLSGQVEPVGSFPAGSQVFDLALPLNQ